MALARKTMAAIAVGAATMGLAAACSSGKSSKPPAQSGSPGAGALKGQSFTILGQWTGLEQSAFQSVINSFDKSTGAKGQYIPAAGGSEPTVLGAKVAGGTPPDIAILSLPGAIAQYGTAGKLHALSAASKAAVAQNFATEWANLATVNGTEYGVPVDASDKSTVWYNATAFKNAGIASTPTTWPGLIADAKTLAASGVHVPISVGGGDGWTLTDWFENVYIRTAGIANYDKLTHHQIKWTDPTVATALTTLKQIWGDKALIGSPSAALTVPFTGSVDNAFKASPTSAIVYEASFVATTIPADKDPAKVGTVAKYFPFPSINGSAPVVEAAGDFAVAFTSNPAAQAFITFLASPKAAQLLVSYPGSGFISANKNLAATAYPDATTAGLGQQIVSVGDNFRFDMSDQTPAAFGGTPNKGEWADLQNFLSNGNVHAAQVALEKDAESVKWTS